MLARLLRGTGDRLALRLTAPSVKRIPCDIVFVIDKSGSTESDATPGLEEAERDGIAVLELIVHLLKITVQYLDERDRVAVVQFDERASVKFPMAFMTPGGKATVCSRLGSIQSSGGTQIWSGIHLGLETLRAADRVDGPRSRSVLVLTDGLDVTKPLRGNMHELRQWIDANAAMSRAVSMHTVGFGNALDSRELFEMASALGGTFSHIPDASTAGTILINRCATELATFATGLRVAVTKTDGTVATAELGSIRTGQTRVVPCGDVARIDVSFFNGLEHESLRVDVSTVEEDAPSVEACMVKADLLGTLRHVVDTCESSSLAWALPYCAQQLAQFRARSELVTGSPYVEACVADVKDQLHKAVENEKWHAAWGMHYLRSYLHATAHEMVSNFRDKAVQFYASPSFKELQEQCERVFVSTPPIPKRPPVRRAAPCAQQQRAAAPVVSYQDRYYGAGDGGCFCPDARIRMSDGSERAIGTLRKGDLVACSGGLRAAVLCVVWSFGHFEMVSIGGFTLTATHPVLDPDAMLRAWVFPKDLPAPIRSVSTRVVNLVLDSNHEIIGAGGLVCCTLGHGLREPVVEHDYLGTDRVVRDLEGLPGFTDGLVEVAFTRAAGPGGGITGVRRAT
jgi:Mg-chelatase subunit ChlD